MVSSLSFSSLLDCLAINSMIDPDGTLDALSNLGFGSPILPAQPKPKSSPVSQGPRPPAQPNCQPEARAARPATGPVAAELENAESEADFSIHFNRFNPDGEEEDATLREWHLGVWYKNLSCGMFRNHGKLIMFVFIIKKQKAWSNSSCFIKLVFFNCDALIVTQILFKS